MLIIRNLNLISVQSWTYLTQRPCQSPLHISNRVKRVEHTTRSGIFLMRFDVFGNAIKHQNIHHLVHFLGYNMLTKFQFHCSITCRDILYFVF